MQTHAQTTSKALPGSRGWAALLAHVATYTVTQAASVVWLPHIAMPIVGAAIAGFGSSMLITALRRSPMRHEQERIIRQLWAIAQRIPPDLVLQDPLTGKRFSVERQRAFLMHRRGFLTLAVTDNTTTTEQDNATHDREATVIRYMLGFGGAPVPPPFAPAPRAVA